MKRVRGRPADKGSRIREEKRHEHDDGRSRKDRRCVRARRLLRRGNGNGGGATTPAQAADYTMKIGTSSAEDTEHFYARAMKEAIEAKSNGKIEVQIFPRGQLGSQSATIQGLQLGTVEGFITPGDFYQGIDPRMGVLSFAFLFKDRAHANRVLADPSITEKVASILDQKGIIGCGQIASGDVRYMSHNPVRKLADFNGKKFRINGTDAERERFRRVGVTSVAMNLADMLTALQNKTIDGSGSGTTIFVNFNLETVSKELLQLEDTLIVSYCGMSKKWLDTLPADLRAMVIKEFARGVSQGRQGVGRVQRQPGQALGGQGRQVQPPLRCGAEGAEGPARHRWRDHHRRQARGARPLQRDQGAQQQGSVIRALRGLWVCGVRPRDRG